MPITFPDGTTAELVYAPELGLSEFRVQPYSSGRTRESDRDFLVFDRPIGEVIAEFAGAELLAEYDDGQGGQVGFWRFPDVGAYWVFEFGRWTVLVYENIHEPPPATGEDRSLWATHFHGHDAPDGFLLLEADQPIRLAAAGEHAGPELQFWSRTDDRRAVLLFPGECTPYVGGQDGSEEGETDTVGDLTVNRESDWFAAWCIPEASMRVHIYQAPGDTFIDEVLAGLEVRNVNLAS